MSDMTLESRVGKLEEKVEAVASDLTGFVQEQREFRQEWRRTKEAETQAAIAKAQAEAKDKEAAAKADRLKAPQLVAMGAGLVTTTAVLLGGLLWLINSTVGSVRGEMAAQQTAVGLQLRTVSGQITATQTAVQVLQRDLGNDRVKLGLVEQQAAATARLVQGMEGYDAHLARQDEQIKALQQLVRDIANRMRP
jgi:chromosome segregation ATPase